MTAATITPDDVQTLVPADKRIPDDPRNAAPRISLLNERRIDYGEFQQIIPELLPIGLTIIYGRPGVAKTTLSDQIEHCIAAGLPIGGYAPDPGELGWCLVLDFESGPEAAVSRSIRIAPWLSLPTDLTGDPDDRIIVDTEFPGVTYEERFAELESRLAAAEEAGQAIRYVRIDTFRAFLGPVPRHDNTAQTDSDRLRPLNKLGERFGCAIVMIHHPNRSGDISGSVSIEGSCNAAYRLDRKPGEDEGRLVSVKPRRLRERDWPMRFDRQSGTWEFDDTITAAQVANSGHRRRILDYIADRGPELGPALDAAVAALADTSAGTIKNARMRLAADGILGRDRDGLWFIDSRPVGKCQACGQPMTVIVDGQTTHPNCIPARPELAFGPGVPGDYWLDKRAAGVEDQADDDGGELAPVVELRPAAAAAGVEDQDQGDEDTPERWPAVQALTRSIEAVRPRPTKWIAKADDPRGQGEGRQHRGMPQWEAARNADRTVGTGYSKRWRPAGLDQLDPARLVVTFDKTQAYVSASGSVAVSRDLLQHFGAFDCDPRELGPPSHRKEGRPAGLAGIVTIEAPAWDHGGMPHPLGPKAVPGEPVVIPSNMLELLWRLHRDEAIARPVVRDAWLGPRHTGMFTAFATAVREARAGAVHDSPLDRAIKTSSNRAVSMLRSEDRGAGLHRPDWHAAIAGESMVRLWVKAWSAVKAGGELAGIGTVDETSWLLPEGVDAAGWLPAGYTLGGKWGDMRPKAVQIREDRADLTEIDPARITPADGHPGHVLVSGPLPLGLWVNRA